MFHLHQAMKMHYLMLIIMNVWLVHVGGEWSRANLSYFLLRILLYSCSFCNLQSCNLQFNSSLQLHICIIFYRSFFISLSVFYEGHFFVRPSKSIFRKLIELNMNIIILKTEKHLKRVKTAITKNLYWPVFVFVSHVSAIYFVYIYILFIYLTFTM